ncbi:MAG: bacillithiol system redox-active protein YtxJ [Cytophagaceae bacterium]|nr:bacillithiol system redox-active protein YtxJ [Cytophagaceae bacterium]
MNWNLLTDVAQLDTLRAESFDQPVLIYKHSTTCSISATTLNRLERNWKTDEMGGVKAYHLDLLRHRALSRAVADYFGVQHESPQVLLIRNGECVYDASHFAIAYPAVKAGINAEC